MKKFSLLFLLVFSFLLNSCSKDEGVDDSTSVAEEGTLKVDFDGKTFVSTSVQAIVNTSISNSLISITGMRAPNGDFIQITLPNRKVGTYTWSTYSSSGKSLGLVYTPANALNAFICVAKDAAGSVPNYTDTGSITITSIDDSTKKISGTFQFTGINFLGANGKPETKVFTNGSFTNISYAADVPALTSNTFSAKLDGVAFVPTNVFALLQNNKIAISARKGSVETIGLFLPSTVKAGTYVVEAYGTDYSFLYNKDMTANGVFTGAGSVTVTSHDTAKKIIKGTFSSKYTSILVKDTHNATEGAFSVSY
jgi:hypothetical protein